MKEIKKQFRGYDMQTVDNLMIDYEDQINKLKRQVATLTNELEHAKEQNSLLQHRVNITEKTNEEIARLAFKDQAIKFRSSVQKMSQDILDTIDNSEVFNLINEEDE